MTLPKLPLVRAAAFAAVLFAAPLLRAQDADDAAPPRLAPWSWETTPSHLRIATALRDVRRASAADGPLLLKRIVESGRDAIPAQLDILLRGRVPETSPKDGPQVLSEAQRGLLLSALAQMPSKAVRKALEARLAATPDDRAAHLGAIYALGTIGTVADMQQLVELAPRKLNDEKHSLPFASRAALRTAIAQLLQRERGAWTALSDTLRKVDLPSCEVLLDSVASTRDPRALGVLFDTARSNGRLAWKAASLVPACGSSLNAETDRAYLEWVRSELPTAEPSYARTLLMGVGLLDDGEWAPTLIEKLEDPDSGIREESLSALRRISGLQLPADPAPWRGWYQSEEHWNKVERPHLRDEFACAETPRVLSALRAYAEHRTHRSELASEVVGLLEHGKPEVRGMAINVLERLGSPAACGALLGMLSDSDGAVGEAAWHALNTISGLELPRDQDRLREILGRS
ncbi:MAG: HEAT repeat domain-containing protein [Planctomycetes bacterium]|nr:HEAT repeat domain-containing protein [Planctomycetota bacterium]